MKIKGFNNILLLLLISYTLIGGCFAGVVVTDDDDDGFIRNNERIQGAIVDVIPSRSAGVEDISVIVTDERTGKEFSDISENTGFFRVDGNFEGSPRVEFFDEDDGGSLLGTINLNVFPGARLDLGNIRLNSRTVVFEDDIEIDFDGKIVENNCAGMSGSITVEAKNDISVEVIVQVLNSTDIFDDNDSEILCDQLFRGDDVRIDGILLVGNNVEADRVEVE